MPRLGSSRDSRVPENVEGRIGPGRRAGLRSIGKNSVLPGSGPTDLHYGKNGLVLFGVLKRIGPTGSDPARVARHGRAGQGGTGELEGAEALADVKSSSPHRKNLLSNRFSLEETKRGMISWSRNLWPQLLYSEWSFLKWNKPSGGGACSKGIMTTA